jgi:hypothetical protein
MDACVETQAKQLYNRTLRELVRNPDDRLSQQRLETVKLFLQTADSSGLRKDSETHLVEGKKVVFTVWQENGKARWEMKVI